MQMTSSTIPKLKCGSIGSNGILTVTLDGIQTVRHHHLSQHQNQHRNQSLRYQLLRKIQTNAQKNSESAILQIGLNIEQEMQRLAFTIYFDFSGVFKCTKCYKADGLMEYNLW